jgi:hypothetical protein
MKEVPIIFTGDMVRAILADLKTQTRRPRKGDKPPCQIGDLLWVRETFRPKTHNFPIGWEWEYRATAETDLTPTDGPWRPSIHMPKDACRIVLEVIDVQAQNLHDMTEMDAIAEGIERLGEQNGIPIFRDYRKDADGFSAHFSFFSLWDSIYGKDAWMKNPSVWAITFKRCSHLSVIL